MLHSKTKLSLIEKLNVLKLYRLNNPFFKSTNSAVYVLRYNAKTE